MKNKLLSILLSAVVAFGLWLYVVTVVSPESEKTYYDIPVVMQNKNILAERGLMIVSDDPKVTLALKSSRTILSDLNESNINVIINLTNIEKAGTHNLTYDISYPGNVAYNEVSVLSSSTDLITLKVENRVRKVIPVEVDFGNTTVQEGYIADLKNIELDYTEIEISGPESVMEQIEKAIIKVDLSNQTNLLVGEYQYALCNEEGEMVNATKVSANVEKISLMLKIQQVKEIALKLEIIDGGGATAQTSTIVMDRDVIQISGSDMLLKDLNELVVDTINLGEILEDQVLTYSLQELLPEGVENLTGVDQITVEIKFPQLMIQTFNVKKFTAVNVSKGMKATIITQALQVTVRGPIDTIKAMKETDLSVVVDFSEAQSGTATMKAEVVIGSAFADVGAVGTYQVSAKLQETK